VEESFTCIYITESWNITYWIRVPECNPVGTTQILWSSWNTAAELQYTGQVAVATARGKRSWETPTAARLCRTRKRMECRKSRRT